MCTTLSSAKEPKVIASFEDSGSVKNWRSVNDGVMGGISKGNFTRTKSNTLLFKGTLSLENNGGFASIRTNPAQLGLDGATALIVKARGDGRTYWVEVRTSRQFGASSRRAYLKTEKGVLKETRIPLADFKLQAFGRQLPGGQVNPADVVSIGFTIADKKPGPFALEIDSVKAAFVEEDKADAKGTIVDVAKKAGSFKTLLAAVNAAGLTDALNGKGPFTVFAPTDDAFAKLPAGTLDDLLKPENKERLVAILEYHVVAGRITLPQALEAGKGTTLEGGELTATFSDKRVKIGTATLLTADVPASNGMIHVIDSVLIPAKTEAASTPQELVELAIERGVPLFNNGDPGACAAVYEVTCEALLLMKDVPKASRKDLRAALAKIKTVTEGSEKAWILRYALDRFLSAK